MPPFILRYTNCLQDGNNNKKSVSKSLLIHPFIIMLFLNNSFFISPIPVILKCGIALSIVDFLRFHFSYLKSETLLTITDTATIATATIVIISIKQSPFLIN